MYNFAALLVLALSIGTPAVAADFIGSVAKAPPPAEVNRRLQGVECSCSPTTFTFKLNLDQTCDDNTIEGKPGVEGTSCFVLSPGNPEVVDFTPIEIEAILIGEQNPDIEAIGQTMIIQGPFFDGDTFSYTSVSAELNPDEPLEDQVEEVPRVIQINLHGVNAAGQGLLSIIAWGYDLINCDAEPIQEGDTIGWIEVVEYTPAIPEFCPTFETEPPTTSPSTSPTWLTPAPTISSAPSTSPTRKLTPAPTNPPTSPRPTDPPTSKPTPSPVVGSMSYSASFSLAHTSKASKAKGKATKSGVSKSEKLIRGRN